MASRSGDDDNRVYVISTSLLLLFQVAFLSIHIHSLTSSEASEGKGKSAYAQHAKFKRSPSGRTQSAQAFWCSTAQFENGQPSSSYHPGSAIERESPMHSSEPFRRSHSTALYSCRRLYASLLTIVSQCGAAFRQRSPGNALAETSKQKAVSQAAERPAVSVQFLLGI